jgi:hypothetical protein
MLEDELSGVDVGDHRVTVATVRDPPHSGRLAPMDTPQGHLPFPADGFTASWATWDGDGDETVELRWENEAWTVTGHVGRERVDYVLRLSPMWQVRQFILFRDLEEPDLWLATDGHGRWGEMNGAHRVELDGCVDVDLPVTPFTNTLPIRRLPLHVGHTADVNVVHVDVETLEVSVDPQRYTRLDDRRWRFTHLTSGWSQDFDVDRYGLVVDYPTLFRRTG